MSSASKIEWTEQTVERETLAYLAGIVDADGYITIQRSVHKGRLYFGAKIGIAGTRREPHDLAASIWGGAVSCYYPKIAGHKPQFQWSRSGKAAAFIIGQLLPFLRVKIEQADCALRLDEHMAQAKSDDPFPWFGPDYEPIQAANEMFMEAKALNCRTPRVGKKAAGRLLDNRTHDDMPGRVG